MSLGKRLLVIDDEPSFAQLVGRVAGELGYAVTVTTEALQFRAAYLTEPPDVIVLDIVMPDQDGIELIEWLVGQGCRARILIISGYSPIFAEAAKLIGEVKGNLDVSLLRKPIKLADLRQHLQD
jgi:CheY-like chemotaxis protein